MNNETEIETEVHELSLEDAKELDLISPDAEEFDPEFLIPVFETDRLDWVYLEYEVVKITPQTVTVRQTEGLL